MSNSNIVTASDWAKGIGFSILASIVGGASKLAIRKSWLMIEQFPATSSVEAIHFDESQQKYHRKVHILATALRTMGMIGMTFINPLFCILAMQYASPSILAPFSGLTLVWIILFSEMLIGEKPLPKQMAAAALIILGEVVVAFFGDHTNDDDMTVQSVIQSYQQVSFQLYFIGMILWMYFVYTLIRHSTPSQVVRQRLGWGLAGGSVNGLQNFLKDSLTLIKASSNHSDTSSFPIILLISFILLAALSAFAGLILLTACMKRYDALFSSAMFVGSFVISASIMSAIHYHTFQQLDSFLDGILYCAGLCLLMVGVYILVEDSFDKEHDSERDDNDHILSTSTNSSTTPFHSLSSSPHEESFTKQEWNEPLVRSST